MSAPFETFNIFSTEETDRYVIQTEGVYYDFQKKSVKSFIEDALREKIARENDSAKNSESAA